MRIRIQTLFTHKKGCDEAEYEDSFGVKCSELHQRSQSIIKCRFAIADGATEASFSAYWADQLVGAALRGELDEEKFSRSLTRLQEQWRHHVEGRDLPWFAEEKARDGAFAAVLSLRLTANSGGNSGRWEAAAIGDCCCFHLSESTLDTFPYKSAQQFGNRPLLLGSLTEQREAEDMINRRTGEWQPGDLFLLMTDALAHWFMAQSSSGCEAPLESLRELVDDIDPTSAFPSWAEAQRDRGLLRNDDTTLIWAEVK